MRTAGLVVIAVVLTVSLHAAQRIDPAEIQLQAAINKATVEGDLKGAIIDLQRILNTAGVSRSVAARVLLQLGQCHEKLGTAEARRSYERILKDYADQGDVARQAGERLATLAKTAAPSPEEALQGRHIIGPSVHPLGVVSPDGKYVAYCCIVVHEVATGRATTIADTGAQNLAFSPDSGEIAYVAQPGKESFELRVIKRTGAGDRMLFKRADVTGMRLFGWMPDGQELLVGLTRDDKSTELGLVPVAGGSSRTVRSPSPYTGPQEPGQLSPDGKYLVYRVQAAGGGVWTTRVFALDGSLDSSLIDRPANAWNVGWTGDGRFVFYSAEKGSEGLWAVKVVRGKAQGPPERVAGKLDDSIQPVGLTRDGAFFYQRRILGFQLYLMSVGPTSGALKTSRVLSDFQSPDWSPDGKFLAYARARSGLVTIHTLATGATRTLWTGLPGAIMALRWYPDLSALAAQGAGPDGARSSVGLRRVDLASGSLSDVLLGRAWGAFGANPTFSADGKLVTFRGHDEAPPVTTLTRHNLDTGSEEILFERKRPQFVSAFSVLPRTGQIAVAVQEPNEPSSVGLLDPSSRELRVIYRTPKGDYIPASPTLAWMPDGKSLLFVTAPEATEGSPMSLYRIPVSGGQPEKLFEAETIFQVRVHPDGSQIAIDTRSFNFETSVVGNLFAARK